MGSSHKHKRSGHHKHRRSRSSASVAVETNQGRQGSSGPDATTQALDRFTAAIATLVQQGNGCQQPASFRGDAISFFDPEDKNQTAENWCKKIDEMRSLYNWSEQSTIYFALAKLKGLALVWYKGLTSIENTWSEWKTKLIEAFPSQREYYDLLMEMIKRVKKPEENYIKYYYEKIALTNLCGIKGKNAVSCILGGISNQIVITGAKAGQYQTPETLY